MLKLCVVVLIAAFIITSARTHGFTDFTEDYCWRDYNGTIPSDALAAGVDNNNNSIYIGQVMYENKLIPGQIYVDDDSIFFEYHEARSENKAVKILCTNYPEKFEWLPVKFYEVFHIIGKHLFEGGYAKGYKFYVGRAQWHGQTTVGKVVCSTANCIRLITVEDGTLYDHDEFDILTYTVNVESSSGFMPYFLLYLMVVSSLLLLFFIMRKC